MSHNTIKNFYNFSKGIVLAILIIAIMMVNCSCQFTNTESKLPETNNFPFEQGSESQINSGVYSPIFRNFKTADLDGDNVSETVVMHDMIDSFGGAGQYLLAVYQKSNDYSYEVIFDSDTYLFKHPNMDIQAIPIGNGTYSFQHSELGLCKEYNVPDSVYPYLFDENENAQEPRLFRIDSFNTVEIVDVDTDGRDEIVLHQYTSIGWHANYLGDCISIFKLVDGDLKLISIDIDITN